MITNTQSGTNVHEIAAGIYRINTPVEIPGAGHFNFNQYLIDDEAPLLFHTGPRRMFPLVREAVGRLIPVARLRYVGFSHFEADECGALNEWLAVAPAGRAGVQPDRGDGLHQRRGGSPGARAGRRGGAHPRPPRRTLARHAAPAARLGLRAHDGDARRARSCAATSSRRAAPARPRSPNRTSSDRARRSARRWTTTRTRRTRRRSSSASRASGPRRSPSCTAARSAAMARRCCVRWRSGSPSGRRCLRSHTLSPGGERVGRGPISLPPARERLG